MALSCDEIFVGERQRSMCVLASSLSAPLSSKLAHYLDLPGQAPQGFQLDTYVSGFTVDDRYIISRTSFDSAAEREGMVFSHAFVFNRIEIGCLHNIKNVFRQLLRERPNKLAPARRDLANEISNSPPPPGRICDMVTIKGTSTVVTTSVDHYEDLVARLWASLLPSMRKDFRFKMSFDPQEASAEKLNLAIVPPSTLARWPLKYRSTAIDDHTEATSAAGKCLAASDKGKLKEFIHELDLKTVSFERLGLIGLACSKFEDYSQSFTTSLAALRLVGTLQPDHEKGVGLKKLLAESVIRQLGPRNPEELLALRNLDWNPFLSSGVTLFELEKRFDECLQATGTREGKQQLIFSIVTDTDATKEWRAAGKTALEKISQPAAIAVASALWNVFSQNSEAGAEILKSVPIDTMDQALAAVAIPTLRTMPTDLNYVLARQKLYLAEVALLRHQYENDGYASLKEACQRDRKVFGDVAVVNILPSLSDDEVLRAAIDLDDLKISMAASRRVVGSPAILSTHDLGLERIQKIWKTAIELSADAWDIGLPLVNVQDMVLATIHRSGIDDEALKVIMGTPVGNWLKYENRQGVWADLSGAALYCAIEQTVNGWIECFPSTAPYMAIAVEPCLAEFLASAENHKSILIAFGRSSLEEILDAFLENRCLSDDLFFDMLSAKLVDGFVLTSADAQKAGSLSKCRNWGSLSRKIFSRYKLTKGLRPYFNVCANHLGVVDRFMNDFSLNTESEISDLVNAVTIDLYPDGPGDREIWSRAGGDSSRLNLYGSGQEKWVRALRSTRFGGPVTVLELVNEMITDYPNNEQLKKLKELL